MAKQGKILRMCRWQLGFKFRSGRKRGEKTMDVVAVGCNYFLCQYSHRATHRTHPLSQRGRHYWRLLESPKRITAEIPMGQWQPPTIMDEIATIPKELWQQ